MAIKFMILLVNIVSHKMYYFNLHIVSHLCFNLAQHLAKLSISIFLVAIILRHGMKW